MKDKLKLIMHHYGLKAQLKQFNSEVFELTEAIQEYESDGRNPISIIVDVCKKVSCGLIGEEYKNSNKEHVIEELADVMVMMEQLRIYYNISTKELRKVFEFKVDRTIERIESKENINSNKNKG